jgi:hypothetical protein
MRGEDEDRAVAVDDADEAREPQRESMRGSPLPSKYGDAAASMSANACWIPPRSALEFGGITAAHRQWVGIDAHWGHWDALPLAVPYRPVRRPRKACSCSLESARVAHALPAHSFSATVRFASTLVALGADVDLEDGRFMARNFRLERSLPPPRVASYLPEADLDLVAAGDSINQLDAWNAHHDNYLDRSVRAGWRGDPFNAADPACPETFTRQGPLDEFGYCDDDLDLVRLEDLGAIARRTARSPESLRDLLSTAAIENQTTARLSRSTQDEVQDVLATWQENSDLDNRPMFAGFWEHAQAALAHPRSGWADEVRDRLGLAHYDPALRARPDGIDVVVFRYPVSLLPRMAGEEVRALARPTVLDGALSSAFCTAPAGTGRGSTIDLAARADDAWDEVVHPAIPLQPQHVWAVDVVRTPSPTGLAYARGIHLESVCEHADPEFRQLADSTDGDL